VSRTGWSAQERASRGRVGRLFAAPNEPTFPLFSVRFGAPGAREPTLSSPHLSECESVRRMARCAALILLLAGALGAHCACAALVLTTQHSRPALLFSTLLKLKSFPTWLLSCSLHCLRRRRRGAHPESGVETPLYYIILCMPRSRSTPKHAAAFRKLTNFLAERHGALSLSWLCFEISATLRINEILFIIYVWFDVGVEIILERCDFAKLFWIFVCKRDSVISVLNIQI
jgi:hypothetical protein